jgi:hypothetical protein
MVVSVWLTLGREPKARVATGAIWTVGCFPMILLHSIIKAIH